MKIRDHITELWQDSWDYSDTGDFYRELQPIVSYKIKRLTQPRLKDVQLTRLRFGHVKLGEKLHKIGQRTDPCCRVCGETEDVEHFLISCPLQRELQQRLRKICTDCKKAYNLKTVLTTDSCTEIVYDYIRTTRGFL